MNMWIVRPADASNLVSIYELQNTPVRQEVFDSDLPPLDQFLSQKTAAIRSGQEQLFVLEQGEEPRGFLSFTKESEFWHVVVWGQWLRTLVYASGVAAFDHLGFPRLVFCVREKNRRMIRICEQYEFRLVGSNSVFVTVQEAPYVNVAKVLYFDITTEEFRQRSSRMRERSLPLQFLW